MSYKHKDKKKSKRCVSYLKNAAKRSRQHAGICFGGVTQAWACYFFNFNSFTLFFLSPECGIAQLSLSLFVSSSWSNLMTSIIFLSDLVHLYDLFCDE